VPNFVHLREWCKQQGIPDGSNEEIIAQPKVHSVYREVVDSYNKYFGHTEQIKRFELLPQEWTVETGEMTPKLSLRRKVVTEKFHDAIERIYS
jgi:long-chain acyl-CoA synthetase